MPPSQNPARLVRGALAPGWFASVGLARSRYLELGVSVEVAGPCLLVFDGERSRRLHPGQTASLRVVRCGPRVIDVGSVVLSGARTGKFEIRRGRLGRMSADVVIRGGIVVDGSGEPGREADVAITGDRISEIGSGLSGKVELDAGGQVVAPGFIDIHTHYDAQVFWDPALSPSCYHGVTSVIAGNCGFSIAPTLSRHQDLIARTLENVEDMNVDSLAEGIPWDFETFPEYLDSISRRGIALNFGAYIGHTALRLFVVGDEAYERASTDEEVARMVEVVAEAIDAGAAGLATSFAMTHRGADGLPIPSRFATRDEFEALIGVLGQKRRGVVSIAPGEQVGIDDMYALQPQVGVPFTYGALLTFPNGNHEKSAAKNREAWEKGIEVWPQVTPAPSRSRW